MHGKKAHAAAHGEDCPCLVIFPDPNDLWILEEDKDGNVLMPPVYTYVGMAVGNIRSLAKLPSLIEWEASETINLDPPIHIEDHK